MKTIYFYIRASYVHSCNFKFPINKMQSRILKLILTSEARVFHSTMSKMINYLNWKKKNARFRAHRAQATS